MCVICCLPGTLCHSMNVCIPQDSFVETITIVVILEDKTTRRCLDRLELERKPFMKENLESSFTTFL